MFYRHVHTPHGNRSCTHSQLQAQQDLCFPRNAVCEVRRHLRRAAIITEAISNIYSSAILLVTIAFLLHRMQLLDLVGGWAGSDDEVVVLAAPALAAILAAAPYLTAATFAKFDVLAVLAAAATKQAEGPQVPSHSLCKWCT